MQTPEPTLGPTLTVPGLRQVLAGGSSGYSPMAATAAPGHHRDMTETPHDTARHGDRGPRVPPAQMRDLQRLRRSTADRRIAGVAGGVGRHLDVDPTVIRVLLVVLTFFGGAGLLLYGAVWMFVPEDGSDEAPIGTSGETRTTVLVVALVLAALLLLGDVWWLGFGAGWPPPLVPLVVLGLVVWLLVRNRGQRSDRQVPPPPPPAGAPPYPPPPAEAPRAPRAHSLFGITMAFVLLGLGAVALVETAGTPLPWAAYPATALTVIGAALLVGAFVGRSTGLGLAGLLAVAVLAVAVWAPHPAFGEVEAHPVRAELVQDRYDRTVGRIHLDLSDVQDVARLDGRVLDLSMQAGEVVVELPAGVDVDVTSRARGGRLDILGRVAEGRDVVNNRSTPDTTAPDLRVDLDLGFGHGRVSRP